MRPRVTNKDAEAFDAYYLRFESAGALEFVNDERIFQCASRHIDRTHRDVSGESWLAESDGGDGDIGRAVGREFFIERCRLGVSAVGDDDECCEGLWIDLLPAGLITLGWIYFGKTFSTSIFIMK